MIADAGCPECHPLLPDATQPLPPNLAEHAWLIELLRDGRIPIAAQPIVYANDWGRVFGWECLLADRRRDGSLRYPARPFPLAQSLGLEEALDVVGHMGTFAQVRTLADPPVFFLNVSPDSLHASPACSRGPLALARASGLPPDHLILEICRDGAGEIEQHREALAMYRAAGVRVALDDLGAHNGPLDLIEALEPDIVKLDRAIVHGVARNPVRAAITGALLPVLRELGMQVVAEGVEQQEDAVWLAERGADYLQGFLFGYPTWPPVRR